MLIETESNMICRDRASGITTSRGRRPYACTKSFVRNLGGPVDACEIAAGRLSKAISRNLSMYVSRESDKGIVSKKPSNERDNNGRRRWRKGL